MLYPGNMLGRESDAGSARTWTETRLLTTPRATLALAIGLAVFAGDAAAEPEHTAFLAPAATTVREADLPTVLDRADVQRYRTIFELQDHGDWSAADAELQQVSDPILVGH